jgi:hypothetical protein
MPIEGGGTMKTRKEELLKHYAKKEPKTFYEYDGFIGFQSGSDDVITVDEDGDFLSGGTTQELFSGAYAMRLLIRPGTEKSVVLRLLGKMADWIKDDPDFDKDGRRLRHEEAVYAAELTQDEIECIYSSLDDPLLKDKLTLFLEKFATKAVTWQI